MAKRYDGSTLLNARSILEACQVLSPDYASEEPISLGELSRTLWFVEAVTLSRDLFFDGTTQADTIDKVQNAVARLSTDYHLPGLSVTAVRFNTEGELLQHAQAALAESRLLVERFQFHDGLDHPVSLEEHQRFVSELAGVRRLSDSQRSAKALEMVGTPFRGNKALAAIVSQGAPAVHIAWRLYELYGADAPRITGAIINRFRLNYLNELASLKRAAYAADPHFESLSDQHARLFKDFLLEQIVHEVAGSSPEPNVLVEGMRASTPLPPLGLYALMVSPSVRRPGTVLETALNEFANDRSLMKYIWEATYAGLRKANDAAMGKAEVVREAFYDRYKQLRKAVDGIDTQRRDARTYVIPAVLKAVGSLVPKALGIGAVGEALYTVLREAGMGASTEFLGDALLQKGCDSYVAQYKSLKWDFEKDERVRQSMGVMAEKVEGVFGRRLAD